MNADLNGLGQTLWRLRLCGLGLALLSSPLSATAPSGPLAGEVAFQKIVPSGTGCPLGTALVEWPSDDQLFDHLDLRFEEFEVRTVVGDTRNAYKYCETVIHFTYPRKWGLSVKPAHLSGNMSIAGGVTGTMEAQVTTERLGPNDKAPHARAWTTVSLKGHWFGDLSRHEPLDKAETLTLPCGLDRPIVVRIVRRLAGAATFASYMTHEAGVRATIVPIKLIWRRCPSP